MNLLHFQKFALVVSAICAPLALVSDDQANKSCPAPSKTQETKKQPTREELFSQSNIDRLSRTYGHLIQKSLSNPVITLNTDQVIQGIKDGQNGKSSPMTDKEYENELKQIQQFAYEEMANKNLKEAEEFLAKNALESGMIVLDNGKVQYKVEKAGDGEQVTDETMPTINYSATYSNGQKLGSSEQTGGPIQVKLNETIPGFRDGIMGMKIGEKRRIFIHPDMGYGKAGQLPNGLLIFEIEVTKLDPKPADLPDDEDDEDAESQELGNLVDSDDLMGDDDDDDDDNDDPSTSPSDYEEDDLEIEEIDFTPSKR